MRSSRRPGVATSTSTPLASARIWRVDRHAADGERDARPQIAPVGREAVDDLGGQLAGGRQHQHAGSCAVAAVRRGGEMVEDGQREGRGLAGPGLRDADHVPRAASTCGMVWAWIGVGVTYCSSTSARVMGSQGRGREKRSKWNFRVARRTGAPNARMIRHWHFWMRKSAQADCGGEQPRVAGKLDTPRGLGCR